MNKKAQLGNLYQYVLIFVLVGMILAVSFIVLANFITATYTATGAVNETMLGNGTHTFANIPVTSISAVYNLTDNSSYNNYTLLNTTAVTIFSDDSSSTWNYSISYTYSTNNSATTSMFSTTDALTPISSNWMPVLVIIAVTSIILAMVISAFGAYKARK